MGFVLVDFVLVDFGLVDRGSVDRGPWSVDRARYGSEQTECILRCLVASIVSTQCYLGS